MWNAGAPEVNQKIISLAWQTNLVLNRCPHTLAQGFSESVHETLLELTPSKCIQHLIEVLFRAKYTTQFRSCVLVVVGAKPAALLLTVESKQLWKRAQHTWYQSGDRKTSLWAMPSWPGFRVPGAHLLSQLLFSVAYPGMLFVNRKWKRSQICAALQICDAASFGSLLVYRI